MRPGARHVDVARLAGLEQEVPDAAQLDDIAVFERLVEPPQRVGAVGRMNVPRSSLVAAMSMMS